MFGPAIFMVNFSELFFRWLFPRRKRRRRRTSRNYHLRLRMDHQVSWVKKLNLAYLRRYNVSMQQYQLWIFKRHGWKYTFVRKKRETEPNTSTEFLPEPIVDDPAEVLRKKLYVPKYLVEAFLSKVDPIHQFGLLKALSDPSLLDSTKARGKYKDRCARALIASAKLVQTSYDHADTSSKQTVYISQKKHELPIVIDSGASYSVTPNLDDFVGPIEKAETQELNGLNATIKVIGQGTVEWKIQDLFGTVRSVKTLAFYVPEANIRLFSPQKYFKENKQASLYMDHACTTLTLNCGTALNFPYNQGNQLPLMLTSKALNSPNKFVGLTFQDCQTFMSLNGGLAALLNVADETNQNLTAAQKELLLWHHKWGHADSQQCQAILSEPRDPEVEQIIKPRHKQASSCKRPLCAACQLGKQGQTSVGTSTQVLLPDRQNLLRMNDLQPGDDVSIDQYMSGTHGRLAHTKGKEAKSKQYVGGTIFVDHSTTKIHHSSQVSLRVGETLVAKHHFESIAREWGHSVKKYHADNAPFQAEEFVRDCTNQNQKISYSGVGAHHQNGVAERAI
jgi:hypothetical protein